MINRIVIFNLLLLVLASCNKHLSGTFVLEGSIKGNKIPEFVLLSYFSLQDNEWYKKLDTAQVINGRFVFEGKLDGLTLAYLGFDYNYTEIDYIETYIEPCSMKLNIDADHPQAYELSGTQSYMENLELRKETEQYNKFRHQKSAVAYKLADRMYLAKAASEKDSLREILYKYSKEISNNNKKMYRIYIDFVSKHNTYLIAPALLYNIACADFVHMDTINSLYNNLPDHLKTGLMGKLAYRQIQMRERQTGGQVESIAPDFVRVDYFGDIIKLSDFKNKSYVLLDFWASWCGPCIKEIPTIKDIYSKYNKDRLKIISISTDEDKNSWLGAIEKYNLKDWPQILSIAHSDNRLFDEDISNIYGIEYIPTFILINKQGKIVARWNNIGEEQLETLKNIID
jgi:thiol-disulfide isomerase/thioredoxin